MPFVYGEGAFFSQVTSLCAVVMVPVPRQTSVGERPRCPVIPPSPRLEAERLRDRRGRARSCGRCRMRAGRDGGRLRTPLKEERTRQHFVCL